jgi:hypothetical protein
MFQAKVRRKGEEGDFQPVLWGGLNYYANKEQIYSFISEMSKYFPENEYIIEEMNV